MGQALEKKTYTQTEYLAIERAAAFKSEYYNGEIFMMAGASLPDNRICQNVSGEIYTFLKKKSVNLFQTIYVCIFQKTRFTLILILSLFVEK